MNIYLYLKQFTPLCSGISVSIPVTREIPAIAKVPWFLVILGVCLIGLVITYFVVMLKRRHEQAEDDEYAEEEPHVKKRRTAGNATKTLRDMDVIPVWSQIILRVILPVACIYIIFNYFIALTSVESGSMEPKLGVGNTVTYNMLAYAKHEPERGDIIMFWSSEQNLYLAKRVIGIPGDKICFADGYVIINGQIADESEYIAEDIETNSPDTFVVPENTVFVLGDNREFSYDSRYWANPYISYDDIVGKYMGQIGINFSYMIRHRNDNKEISAVSGNKALD